MESIRITFKNPRRGEPITVEVGRNSKLEEAIRKAGYLPGGVVVLKGSRPVPHVERVEEGEYTLIEVASGG
ncbi:hypothetical protein B6U83_01990 [Thermoplasmatales archaeon ex4484_36]|nr:MAG: hypothetical protein B6U83_01990 [Thermoplasmatales archaeon ex4484_36]RLF72857.1 MAG: hypothetical protein DRN55_05285 [Thermoplasmata archaeon]HDD59328.1 hypothetical protein [Euryarchaeota archaeon]